MSIQGPRELFLPPLPPPPLPSPLPPLPPPPGWPPRPRPRTWKLDVIASLPRAPSHSPRLSLEHGSHRGATKKKKSSGCGCTHCRAPSLPPLAAASSSGSGGSPHHARPQRASSPPRTSLTSSCARRLRGAPAIELSPQRIEAYAKKTGGAPRCCCARKPGEESGRGHWQVTSSSLVAGTPRRWLVLRRSTRQEGNKLITGDKRLKT